MKVLNLLNHNIYVEDKIADEYQEKFDSLLTALLLDDDWQVGIRLMNIGLITNQLHLSIRKNVNIFRGITLKFSLDSNMKLKSIESIGRDENGKLYLDYDLSGFDDFYQFYKEN